MTTLVRHLATLEGVPFSGKWKLQNEPEKRTNRHKNKKSATYIFLKKLGI
jgi:hypothetical protein